MDALKYVRPAIQAIGGYTPGEQPAPGTRIIKLNTNENPFGPPQAVMDALKSALDDGLKLYPEPSARPLREAAGRLYGIDPDGVVAGNGSDDLLTMILRTFIDKGDIVTAPSPTYSLYATLTHIQGGTFVETPWGENYTLPIEAIVKSGAKVVFVVRPNAPTGHAVPLADISRLCEAFPGIVILDEAYADFGEDNGIGILDDHPNMIITRTFSKSLSLAGLRIGLGLMHPKMAGEFHKVRDSYNVDRLAQAAATAALDHWADYQPHLASVRTERARLAEALSARGFTPLPSQANFILTSTPNGDGLFWLNALKARGFLIRYFGNDPRLTDKIRITIGTPQEMALLMEAVDGILAAGEGG